MTESNTGKAAVNSEKYSDKKHSEVSYSVGDINWVHYPTRYVGKSEKLLHNFQGAFEIKEKGSNGADNKMKGSIRGKKTIIDKIHVIRLKPFYDSKHFISRIENVEGIDEKINKTIDTVTIAESTDSDEPEICELE